MEYLASALYIISAVVMFYLIVKIVVWLLIWLLYVLRYILLVCIIITLVTLQWPISLGLFILLCFSEAIRNALIKPAILSMINKMGMGTAEQIARRSRKSLDDVNAILENLVSDGKVEAIRVANGVAYKLPGASIKGDNFVSDGVISLD